LFISCILTNQQFWSVFNYHSLSFNYFKSFVYPVMMFVDGM